MQNDIVLVFTVLILIVLVRFCPCPSYEIDTKIWVFLISRQDYFGFLLGKKRGFSQVFFAIESQQTSLLSTFEKWDQG